MGSVPNHYHLVGFSPNAEGAPSVLAGRLHGRSSRALNVLDNQQGRKVWYQFRDTLLTSEKSYYARLRYVHENPVKHGLVREATSYRWCSATWFRSFADATLCSTVKSFKIDRVNVGDDEYQFESEEDRG